ncbi:tRNA-specific adenosine deaminase [Niveomyces insectorum RCEF 264]|uniref:tRNA-specific adenosine deaminase n=1 Tax=Niveomyces insectorum RCEF 264 TaxID=1081102 RepID=A0A167W9M8_9HYPO|nr:tRNA-specific adenosine deaminase [Niveomyces insectorum RCEF 264]
MPQSAEARRRSRKERTSERMENRARKVAPSSSAAVDGAFSPVPVVPAVPAVPTVSAVAVPARVVVFVAFTLCVLVAVLAVAIVRLVRTVSIVASFVCLLRHQLGFLPYLYVCVPGSLLLLVALIVRLLRPPVTTAGGVFQEDDSNTKPQREQQLFPKDQTKQNTPKNNIKLDKAIWGDGIGQYDDVGATSVRFGGGLDNIDAMHKPKRGGGGGGFRRASPNGLRGKDNGGSGAGNSGNDNNGGNDGGAPGRPPRRGRGGRGGGRLGGPRPGDTARVNDEPGPGRPPAGRRGGGRGRGRGRGSGRGRGGARDSVDRGGASVPVVDTRAPLMPRRATAGNAADAQASRLGGPAEDDKVAGTAAATTAVTTSITTPAKAVKKEATTTMKPAAAPKVVPAKVTPAVAGKTKPQPTATTTQPAHVAPRVRLPAAPITVPAATPATVPAATGAVAVPVTLPSSDKDRRARRAQRATQIFQEQRRQQKAEDAARQERVLAAGGLPTAAAATASVSLTSSLSLLSLTSSSSAGSRARTNSGARTTTENLASGPTFQPTNAPPAAATAATTANSTNSSSYTTTFLHTQTRQPPPLQPTPASNTTTISSRTITAPAGTAAPATSIAVSSKQGKSDGSGCIAGAAAATTMAYNKVDGDLLDLDADSGSDSDDVGSGFVMTRTTGKRRGNLTPGDMLANEILHDINEDLVVLTEDNDECDPVKRLHRGYMNEAVAMAQLALRTNETPVGCVLVRNGRVIARGMNATNMTRNGTRHAELMCLNALLAYWDDVSESEEAEKDGDNGDSDCESGVAYDDDEDDDMKEYTESDWEKVDPSKGHLYPYGQKLHPARVVSPDIIRECSLYVTVEPCIMCASMLRQYGIQKVYFGAANDKFGGTGGVLRIHMNSKPNEPTTQNATYIETYVTNMMARPRRSNRAARNTLENSPDTSPTADDAVASVDDTSAPSTPVDIVQATAVTTIGSGTATATIATATAFDNAVPSEPPVVRRASTIPIAEGSVPARDEGHGGNIEPGFDVEGGWGRDKAVFLLRQFYVQENGRAPAPRKKEGRAQRLVQQMKNESSSTVRLPPSVDAHRAEVNAELDALPLDASTAASLEKDGSPRTSLDEALDSVLDAIDDANASAD